MNTHSGAASEPQSRDFATTVAAGLRPVYWSVRRELWENRSIYLAPLVAAALFLLGYTISIVRLRLHMDAVSLPSALETHHSHDFAPALIMGVAIIVSIFYCLDALYGERRDRSILFWKSLPVSDTTTVISKLAIPILILPLVSFVITIATQLMMLVLSSAILAGGGVSISSIWAQASFRVSLIWLYHFVTVHGLWYAPLYGWLLLISAWAPRAPFMWAFLPPFVIWGVEKIAFNTSYFLSMLQYRLTGPGPEMTSNEHAHDFAASLIPHHFLSTPGLWTGLLVAVIFLAITVRLRRLHGPI
ncbi:MAG TPA: hypothetical protein VJO35_11775 [Terriglobales bacterium]|nr:hypothetical protein [Terriglobales bacterium]